MKLCEVGEISYLTWNRKFTCSKIGGCTRALLKDIEENCETMESELEQWRKTINDRRHHCYSLNHFTMKQILNLRKELAKACTGQVPVDELPLQIYMLLETVDRNIDPLVLSNVLRTMIPENSITLTEDGFKDERKYFAGDPDDEIIVDEFMEEEVAVISPEIRLRKNSLESFTSAKETLEEMGYAEEYALAALQHCGRHASEDEMVAWVASCESHEDVMKLCEEAKRNPHLSDLLKDEFGSNCDVKNEEMLLDNAAVFDRYIFVLTDFIIKITVLYRDLGY